jgi:hypothetical protein
MDFMLRHSAGIVIPSPDLLALVANMTLLRGAGMHMMQHACCAYGELHILFWLLRM